ncbi:MAG: beta-phosphoglucomutase [Spirochaetes bacterium]|nr:beta-phosphoglucomutase [Spirochaetota bacterium]
MRRKVEGYIFDLDGVLTNTSEFHYLAWKRIAEELKIPFDRKINENLKGVSRHECLRILLGERNPDSSLFEELLARKNSYYRDYIKRITPKSLLPGALNILDCIREKGGRIAVASVSKNTDEVMTMLGIRGKFDVILDGYSVKKTKPEPEQFLLASKMLSIVPGCCVVFEDSSAGIEAAKRAGMLSVGIGSSKRLDSADLVFNGLDKIEFNSMLGKLERF